MTDDGDVAMKSVHDDEGGVVMSEDGNNSVVMCDEIELVFEW